MSSFMPYARSHFRRSVKPLYEIYKKIGRVYCPALKTHVFFDKQGFSHFFYKGKSRNYKLRNHTVAWERVNCLPEVIRILREKPVVRRTIRNDVTIVQLNILCAIHKKTGLPVRGSFVFLRSYVRRLFYYKTNCCLV